MAALAIVVPAHAASNEKPAVAARTTETAATGAPPRTTTLERIKAAGKIVLGYRADAAPMSYRDSSGQPAGYAVALCNRVVDAMKSDLGASSLAVEWIAVGSGFADVQDRRVDMICAADEVTQANRENVSFSIPIFPGGVSALVRANAPKAFQQALEERPKPYEPLWRGSPPPTLEHRTYSALVGSATMDRAKGEHRRATVDRERATGRGLRRRHRRGARAPDPTCCSAIARNCCKPCSATRTRKTYGC